MFEHISSISASWHCLDCQTLRLNELTRICPVWLSIVRYTVLVLFHFTGLAQHMLQSFYAVLILHLFVAPSSLQTLRSPAAR